MESPKITYKYYSNPAFCAQSEVVYTQQAPCVSPRVTTSPSSKNALENKRIPPLGANSPRKLLIHQELKKAYNHRVKTDISDNPLRNTYSKNDGPLKYVKTAQLEMAPKPGPKPKSNSFRRQSNHVYHSENLEMARVGNEDTDSNTEEETVIENRFLKHRYAEIPDDYEDYSPSKKRIIETAPEEYNVDVASEDEATQQAVPTEIVRSVNGKLHRYAIVPSDDDYDDNGIVINFEQDPNSPPTFHIRSPGMSRKNLEATQKLHEYLSTPRKRVKKIGVGSPMKPSSSSPNIRSQINAQNAKNNSSYVESVAITPSKTTKIISSTPKKVITPSKSCVDISSPALPRRNNKTNSSFSPRAQQKLVYNNMSPKKSDYCDLYIKDKSIEEYKVQNQSYNMNNSKDFSNNFDKQQLFMARSTAIISPRMISRGSSSIYSDGFSNKNWKPTPGCATLILVAAMLALCGGLSAALSFYMMHTIGREYYLDIGVLSGFICMILGLLGFRSRTERLLPNRNYISGYIVVSVFSLLSCGALLALMILGPEWGHGALKGIVGGAVAGLGVLCLLLAVIGTVSSYCCGHPPPDNRVADARDV